MLQHSENTISSPEKYRPSSRYHLLLFRCSGTCLALMLLGGCASYAIVTNTPSTAGKAVAASSAVPVVFNPVAIENFAGCEGIAWPPQVEELAKQDAESRILYEGAQSYQDKENRKYIHYVDGGIIDNLGLRAMTDVQLHRYNAATEEMVHSRLMAWAEQASTPEHQITPHFIELGFEEVPQPQLKYFLNKIPTSFSLSNEQVDTLIDSARTLLRSDPAFQQLLADLAIQ